MPKPSFETPAAVASPVQHLTQLDLARRWRLSPRTLERWRWLNQGPQFLKLRGRVVYRAADVEAFEKAQIRRETSSSMSFGPTSGPFVPAHRSMTR